jgi:hypothetical protein
MDVNTMISAISDLQNQAVSVPQRVGFSNAVAETCFSGSASRGSAYSFGALAAISAFALLC